MRHNNQRHRETRRVLEYLTPPTKWEESFVVEKSNQMKHITSLIIKGYIHDAN